MLNKLRSKIIFGLAVAGACFCLSSSEVLGWAGWRWGGRVYICQEGADCLLDQDANGEVDRCTDMHHAAAPESSFFPVSIGSKLIMLNKPSEGSCEGLSSWGACDSRVGCKGGAIRDDYGYYMIDGYSNFSCGGSPSYIHPINHAPPPGGSPSGYWHLCNLNDFRLPNINCSGLDHTGDGQLDCMKCQREDIQGLWMPAYWMWIEEPTSTPTPTPTPELECGDVCDSTNPDNGYCGLDPHGEQLTCDYFPTAGEYICNNPDCTEYPGVGGERADCTCCGDRYLDTGEECDPPGCSLSGGALGCSVATDYCCGGTDTRGECINPGWGTNYCQGGPACGDYAQCTADCTCPTPTVTPTPVPVPPFCDHISASEITVPSEGGTVQLTADVVEGDFPPLSYIWGADGGTSISSGSFRCLGGDIEVCHHMTPTQCQFSDFCHMTAEGCVGDCSALTNASSCDAAAGCSWDMVGDATAVWEIPAGSFEDATTYYAWVKITDTQGRESGCWGPDGPSAPEDCTDDGTACVVSVTQGENDLDCERTIWIVTI